MAFLKYLKAVGTGVKGNRDLTFEEARDAMRMILQRQISNEEIAAFLIAWRLKPETQEELLGAFESFEECMNKTTIADSLELGYPFDGKAKNPYIFPLVAKLLQSHNLPLVISIDELQPAKAGVTTKQIAANYSCGENIHFFDRKKYFTPLHNLTTLRNKLGLRTIFNSLEKLTQVASSPYGIAGVFHTPYVKKYMQLFAPKYKRFALVSGNEGTPELFSKGHIWLSENGELQKLRIDLAHYGIIHTKATEKLSLQESLQLLENPPQHLQNIARLNAAIWLFVSEKANSIDEAFEMLG